MTAKNGIENLKTRTEPQKSQSQTKPYKNKDMHLNETPGMLTIQRKQNQVRTTHMQRSPNQKWHMQVRNTTSNHKKPAQPCRFRNPAKQTEIAHKRKT